MESDLNIQGTLDSALEFLDASQSNILKLTEENQTLKAKLATMEEEKVVLQKVASSGEVKKLDASLVSATLERLANRSLIDEGSITKLASELELDPNNALLLAQRVIEVYEPAHDEGQGVKSAYAATEKQFNAADEWEEVLAHGAK